MATAVPDEHVVMHLLRLAGALLLWLCLLLGGAIGLAVAQLGNIAIPPLDSPVVDTTGTLSGEQKQQLIRQSLELQQRKGSQLQLLMIPSTQPETIEQYAVRAFEAWKIGRKGVDDGVLLVIAKDDRKVRIEVGYGLEGAIPDITAGRIIQEYIVPRFRDGDYGGGVVEGTAAITRLIDGEPLPEPMAGRQSDPAGDGGGASWLFALFAGVFAASVLRGMLGRSPAGIRGLVSGAGAGAVAWMLSTVLGVGLLGAVIGFVMGLIGSGGGGFANGGGWGGYGGGWGGGGGWSGGGSSGGGWSGGGGSSGGGGASGSW